MMAGRLQGCLGPDGPEKPLRNLAEVRGSMSGEDEMEPVLLLLGKGERVLHEDDEVVIVEEIDRELMVYRDGRGVFHVEGDPSPDGYTVMIDLER